MTRKKKFVCPYTYPHKSRKAKVDYITDIGGYFSRDGQYPLEFNVACYSADLDFESLFKTLLESGEVGPDVNRDDLRAAAALAYKEDSAHLWDWALEDAVRNIHETDCYRMLWDGTMVDVKLSLYGRGGKHLCIESFEGMSMRGLSPEDLHEKLMRQYGWSQSSGYEDDTSEEPKLRKGWDWEYSNEFIDKLYRYVRQCEVDFTPAKAGAEVQYQAAWHLGRVAEDALEALQQARADREALVDAAKTVAAAIDTDNEDQKNAFALLCRAAALDVAEVLGVS